MTRPTLCRVVGSILLLAAVAVVAPRAGAEATLLADLYDEPAAHPGPQALPLATLAGGRVVVALTDPLHGREPWVSDGSDAGTRRLADLVPGPDDGLAADVPAVSTGSRAFLLAGSRLPWQPQGLWVTGGTPQSTRRLVSDLLGADIGASLTVAAGRVFVLAQDRARQPGLWVSDGTPAGTRRLPHAGLPGQRPGVALTVIGGRLLFVAGTGIGGSQEVWVSDGTAGGTRRLLPGPVAGPPFEGPPLAFHAQLLSDGTAVVFQDLGPATGPGPLATAIWHTDGTPGGTVRSTVVDGRWLDVNAPPIGPLAAFATWDFEAEPRLWVSDGSEAGTRLVLEREGGFRGLVWLQDRLLFATGGVGPSTLWTLAAGGAPQQVATLAGIFEGPPVAFRGGASFVLALGNEEELWWTDGTPGGTRRTAPLGPREGITRILGAFDVGGGEELVLAVGQGAGVWDLFLSDGTRAGTRRVGLHTFLDERGLGLPGLRAVEHGLLFAAAEPAGPRRLWVSDGTAAGTVPLAAPPSGAADGDSWPHDMTAWGDRLFFFALDPTGWGLWETDGTPGLLHKRHRTPFAAPFADPELRSPERLLLTEGRLYFLVPTDDPSFVDLKVANLATFQAFHLGRFPDGHVRPRVPGVALGHRLLWAERGERLVVSDGSLSGTGALDLEYAGQGSGLAPLETPQGPAALVVAQRRPADGPASGATLWRTDGTPAGTAEVLPAAGAAPSDLAAAADGRVWFSHGGLGPDAAPPGLWVSDGTAEGTLRVEAFDGRRPERLVETEAGLFFVLSYQADGSHLGHELWLRPAAGGPSLRLLEAGPVGEPFFVVDWAVPFRGGLLFVAYDPFSGVEPWFSDGTAAGTRRLGELAAGAASSFPSPPVVAGERAFFAAAGRLWRTDGTAAGTVAVAGDPPAWEATGEVGRIGDRLVVAARTPVLGREPWTLPTAEPAQPPPPAPPRPAAPTDLAARSHVGYVWLSWTAPADGLRYFEVQARSPGEPVYRTLVRLPAQAFLNHGVSIEDLPPDVPHTFRVRAVNAAGASRPSAEATGSNLDAAPAGCESSPTRLCLLDGRFAVDVVWRDPRSGDHGPGRALPFPGTDLSGTFWFFRDANVELIVKALDGTPVNRRWWVFTGGLTDVEYWLRVTDAEGSEVDRVRWYHHPPRDLCGFADTEAFPGRPGDHFPLPSAAAGAASAADPDLDLLGGRYRVTVDWRDPRSGDTGSGHAVPGSDNTGYFWFFRDGNVELVVKVLDGTPVNGHHWVFWGGLTDVEYTLHVTDLESGASRDFHHAAGDLCGGAETEAFLPVTTGGLP